MKICNAWIRNLESGEMSPGKTMGEKWRTLRCLPWELPTRKDQNARKSGSNGLHKEI
jgi:hypothetical protein